MNREYQMLSHTVHCACCKKSEPAFDTYADDYPSRYDVPSGWFEIRGNQAVSYGTVTVAVCSPRCMGRYARQCAEAWKTLQEENHDIPF